jgi:hypothetical protein
MAGVMKARTALLRRTQSIDPWHHRLRAADDQRLGVARTSAWLRARTTRHCNIDPAVACLVNDVYVGAGTPLIYMLPKPGAACGTSCT